MNVATAGRLVLREDQLLAVLTRAVQHAGACEIAMDHQGDGRRGVVTPRSSTALEKAAAVALGHQLVIDMYSACKHDALITPRVHHASQT